jgi:hypothetical protein
LDPQGKRKRNQNLKTSRKHQANKHVYYKISPILVAFAKRTSANLCGVQPLFRNGITQLEKIAGIYECMKFT